HQAEVAFQRLALECTEADDGNSLGNSTHGDLRSVLLGDQSILGDSPGSVKAAIPLNTMWYRPPFEVECTAKVDDFS
ncbi:MAG: hypothetical protein KAX42_11265, partial [Sphaerotilus sp.]|nr:hypothetical protein [Sphaerotilus sp.]